jgi:putative membrane protein
MITRYTDHVANERTFLAWVRTGLAVAAFGFFLVKLNVFSDVTGGASPPHALAENAGAFVAAAARYAGLAIVVTRVAIIGRSSAGFERTRRAIDRDEVIRMPRSRMESMLSVALAIAVAIFCVYLEALTFSARDSGLNPTGDLMDMKRENWPDTAVQPIGLVLRQKTPE